MHETVIPLTVYLPLKVIFYTQNSGITCLKILGLIKTQNSGIAITIHHFCTQTDDGIVTSAPVS